MANKTHQLEREREEWEIQQENERKLHEAEIRKNYVEFLESKDREHQRGLDKMHERLKQEQCRVSNSYLCYYVARSGLSVCGSWTRKE